MSAVIYAAIVVMWAVVLVPMWLHRRDEATESRSVDRFSTAMRTLSRRTPATPGRRYVVMPRRSEQHAPSVHVSGAKPKRRSLPSMPSMRSMPSVRSLGKVVRLSRRNGRISIVARRRRMLLLLIGAGLLTLILATTAVSPWWLQITVDVLFLSFCAHLRVQARRAATVSRQRRRATVATSQARVSAPARVTRPASASAAPASSATPSYATYAAYGAVAAEQAPAYATYDEQVAFEDRATDEFDRPETWEPVPVPPPTYTMKPPAPAFEADPTYSPPVYQPRADGDPESDDRESDLDEILERRWAVND